MVTSHFPVPAMRMRANEMTPAPACVRDRQEPLVNGARARDAVRVAEAVIGSAHGDTTLGLAQAA